MRSGFHHAAFHVADIEAEVRFWREAFGLEPKLDWRLDNGNRAVMLDAGKGDLIEIFERPGHIVDAAWPLFHLALRSDDVDQDLARAHAAGAEIKLDPKDLVLANRSTAAPGEVPIRIAFFRTPGGALIELLANAHT